MHVESQPSNSFSTSSSSTHIQPVSISEGIQKSPRKLSSTSTFSKPLPSLTVAMTAGAEAAAQPPPIITITTTDEEKASIDGMLDRISHDLDYLLNRTTEIPAQVRRSTTATTAVGDMNTMQPGHPPPTASSISTSSATSSTAQCGISASGADVLPPPPPPPIGAPPSAHPTNNMREVILPPIVEESSMQVYNEQVQI